MQRRRFFEEEMRREKEEKDRKFRYSDRNNVEELIGPILSLYIVKEYYNKPLDSLQMESVQDHFDSHSDYMNAWMPLFLYETYNQIISSRGASSLDRELSELLGRKSIRNDDEKNFMCQLKKDRSDGNYVYLKVFEDKNIQGKPDRFGNYTWP